MEILSYNTGWMIWNTLLAVAALFFGYLMISVRIKIIQIVAFILWLLFIPNTIYVLTDIYHLFPQVPLLQGVYLPVVIAQYVILLNVGVITFVLGIEQLEKLLHQIHFQKEARYIVICAVNFVISFGVILGRFQRTNSWEVFTHPFKVINDVLAAFFTTEHMIYVLSFGFLCNVLYFSLSKRIKL